MAVAHTAPGLGMERLELSDGTYFVYTTDSWRLGVGGLLRFTGATAKFTSGDQTIETDAGGVQFAVGARIRF